MRTPKFPILHVWLDELSEIVKDEGILIFIILLPLAYPLLYAMIYNTETQRQLPICVVDDNMSDRSRDFIRRIDATPEVKIATHYTNMEEAKEKGINDSIIHVDFMVGADDLSIDGIRPDGSVTPIFRNGTWN